MRSVHLQPPDNLLCNQIVLTYLGRLVVQYRSERTSLPL
eukprot:COSAG06_NODE_51762_length_310_cov_0.691943_1_plen_38_part_10